MCIHLPSFRVGLGSTQMHLLVQKILLSLDDCKRRKGPLRGFKMFALSALFQHKYLSLVCTPQLSVRGRHTLYVVI